jgi:hypothetical protein
MLNLLLKPSDELDELALKVRSALLGRATFPFGALPEGRGDTG